LRATPRPALPDVSAEAPNAITQSVSADTPRDFGSSQTIRHGSPVSVEDLARFAGTFADLADPDVMSQAWT